MKVSIPKILGTCVLVILGGVLLFPMLYNPTYPAPSAQTRNSLAQAELVVRIVEKENPSYLEKLTNSAMRNHESSKEWQKLIDDNLDLIGLDREKARAILCFDAWTNEFNVFLKKDLPEDQCSRRLLDKTLPLVIWSSGPNRSNEFGKGDDVVYEPPNTVAQDGAANGSQPFRSETNTKSSAAGSRR